MDEREFYADTCSGHDIGTNVTPDGAIKFIQGLINHEGYRAFSADINRKRTLEETHERKVVEILKGATLIPLDVLDREGEFGFFLRTPKANVSGYFVERRNGPLSTFSDVGMSIGSSSLFVDYFRELDLTRVASGLPSSYAIPRDMITGRLDIHHHWEHRDGFPSRSAASYHLYGNVNDRGKLFGRLTDFLDGKSTRIKLLG